MNYVCVHLCRSTKDGVIAEVEWQYIWMVPFLRTMPISLAVKSVKTFLQRPPSPPGFAVTTIQLAYIRKRGKDLL